MMSMLLQMVACQSETRRVGALLSNQSPIVFSSTLLSALIAVDVVIPSSDPPSQANSVTLSYFTLTTKLSLLTIVVVSVVVAR